MVFKSQNKKEEWIALALIVLGVLSRLLPHPENFTPLIAIALFAGITLPRRMAVTVPLAAMIFSDLFIGSHPLFWLTWSAFFLVNLLGILIQKNATVSKIFFGALGGSLLFFILTNLGVFVFEQMYPKNWNGFVECYLMALPFFRNQLLGDMFYTTGLFMVFGFAKNLKAIKARSSI